MKTRRILLTGGSGYLGAALLHYLCAARPAWDVYATYFSNPLDSPHACALDLRDPASIHRVLREIQPDLIFHTAAQMTGPLEILRSINASGTEILARRACESGARLIHLSSDVIFDGRHGPYREEDRPNPITPYGKSKFEAEQEVLASGVEAVIVRTSLIYGFDPLDPRTRAMLNGTLPRLFTDERRCPIEVMNLCEALVELSELSYTGILNVAGPQALSRYAFGVKLIRVLGGDTSRLIAMRSEESGLVRPKDCTLDVKRARALLKTNLLGVDEVLESYLTRGPAESA